MESAKGKNKIKILGALCAAGGGICWGLSGCVGQYLFGVKGMDSKWLVPIRLALAGLILIVFCLIKYGAKNTVAPWKRARERGELLIYGILGVSLCQFTYFLTIQLSSAGVATIMQDLSPAIILVYACASRREKPKAIEITAVVLALIGVTLIVTHGSFSDMAVSVGALISGVISAFAVAVYNIAPKTIIQKHPIVLLQGWAFLMGGVLAGAIFRPWSIACEVDLASAAGIAFVVLVGNVAAFQLYLLGVKLIGPKKSILYGFSEPVTAALVSLLFLGSPFTLFDALGFAAVFAMLILISKS